MTQATPHAPSRFQRVAVLIGVAGAVASLAGAVFNRPQFVQSYLTAYLFWLSIALGCLPILLLHHLAGGRWGFVIRRFLEAGVKTLPLLAVLFLPLLTDLPSLYLWAQPAVVAHDPVLQHKAAYLNVPFWVGRAIFYFALWMVLGRLALRWGAEQEQRRDNTLSRRLRGLGAIGLGLYGLSITFAAIDWSMSLDPHWFSTMYGLILAVGQMLAGFALAVICLAAWRDRPALREAVGPQQVNDLGNFLMAFVMLWAYLAFSQFLIIWSGNLREEIPWYLHRLAPGWQTMAMALLVLHFAVPFAILLSPRVKTNVLRLRQIAVWLLVMRLVDLYWNVAPTFSEHGIRLHWLDAATLIGLGGLWTGLFLKYAGAVAILPAYDVRAHAEDHHE